jgi:hypothetical protein
MKSIRIGAGLGFYGDAWEPIAASIERGGVQFIASDHLAELTLAILQKDRQRDPALGYARDVVPLLLRLWPLMQRHGVRFICNAGGLNPHGAAQAVLAAFAAKGLKARIAVVTGDDVLPRLRDAAADFPHLFNGAPVQGVRDRLVFANAYLGAAPIVQALDAGAQIVITGRSVDSAVTLGVLMHEFQWAADDFDRLAQGSLAGHIIECGAQATGGLHTDWEQVPDWADNGYPVVECRADGSFTVGKPPDTGGLVSTATVGEQILYEIGDPAAYILPDVVCDFTQVRLRQLGPDLVELAGARGRAPTDTYKVSATYVDGWRCNAQLTIVGVDAVRKVERTAEAILERTRRLFAEQGLGDYTRTHVDILGAESPFGPHARTRHTREAVMRLAVTHADRAALQLFAREVAPAGTSWSPGTTGAGGRATPVPSIQQYAFLLDKGALRPAVVMDGNRIEVSVPPGVPLAPAPDASPLPIEPMAAAAQGETVEVPLIAIAWGRSGDKGDISNIGLIARRPEYLPLIRAQVTPQAVGQWLGHLVKGRITRYDLPGFDAVNLVCEEALDGGGMASLRNDPLGKGMAQILLTMPVRVPKAWGLRA